MPKQLSHRIVRVPGHTLGVGEVAGSNPVGPIFFKTQQD